MTPTRPHPLAAVITHRANWPHIARIMAARESAGLPTRLIKDSAHDLV